MPVPCMPEVIAIRPHLNTENPAALPKFRLIFSLQTADKLLGEVCAAGILRGPPFVVGNRQNRRPT